MYVIARNNSGRPTLMHFLLPSGFTACGLDSRNWPSRAYPRSMMREIYCKRCAAVPAASLARSFRPRDRTSRRLKAV